MSPGTTSPHELLRVVFRHKWKICGVFVCTLAAVAVAIVVWPRSYVSEAKLFVRLGRESIGVDPTATTGETMQVRGDSRTSEINSILELLKSRELAQQVVDQLSPQVVLGEETDANAAALTPIWWDVLRGQLDKLRASISLDPVSPREQAISTVMGSFEVSAPEESDVITVSYKSASPQLAQQVASVLVENYLQSHMRVHRTSGSEEFFENRSQLAYGQLAEAQRNLLEAKNYAGVLSVEGRRTGLQERINWVDTTLLQTEQSRDASQAEVERLQVLFAGLPSAVPAETVDGHPEFVTDQMRQRLYELELADRELRSTLGERHPDYIAGRLSIEKAREILQDQKEYRTTKATKPNPVREVLETELVNRQAEVASLDSQLQRLIRQREELGSQLATLNEQEIHIQELQEAVNLRLTQYRDYLKKLEQVRIDAALAAESITNVNVVQQPTFVEQPVAPQKAVLLIAGMFLAVTGALVVAFTAEYIDHTLKTPTEIESALRLPVLVSIPRTSSHALA